MANDANDLLRAVLALGGRVAILDAKVGARADANSTFVETERRWLIRGVYPDGKKLQFNLNAFDHSDAKKKAEAKKGGAKITDIVLADSVKADARRKDDVPPASHLLKEKDSDRLWLIRGISMSGGKAIEVKVRAKDYEEARQNAARRGIKIHDVVLQDSVKTDAAFSKWKVPVAYDGKTKDVTVRATNADDAKRFALESLGDAVAGGKGKAGAAVKVDADPKKPDPGGKYNAEAVQKEINKDKRIKPGEAKLIHSLLKGRTG